MGSYDCNVICNIYSISILGIIKKITVGQFVFLTDGLQLIFAILLICLGFMVAVSCFKKLFKKDSKNNVVTTN